MQLADTDTSCRLCREPNKLIKAHIIPRIYFEDIKGDEDFLFVIGKDEKTISRIGIYDKTILCDKCENTIFAPLDDYGRRLIKKINEQPVRKLSNASNSINIKVIENFDYKQTKLFLVSILWRASVSSRVEYNSVDLGCYEDLARHMLQTQTEESGNIFQTIVQYLEPSKKVINGQRMVLLPYKTRFESINAYRMHFGGLKFSICVDSRGFSTNDTLEHVRMKAGASWPVAEANFDNSNDYRYFRNKIQKYR